MEAKKKRFTSTRRFIRRHNHSLKHVWNVVKVLSVIVGLVSVIPMFIGDKFIIIERIHEVTLDLTNAVAHRSVALGLSVSCVVTFEMANGTTSTFSDGVMTTSTTQDNSTIFALSSWRLENPSRTC